MTGRWLSVHPIPFFLYESVSFLSGSGSVSLCSLDGVCIIAPIVFSRAIKRLENVCFHCQKLIYPPWTRGTLASYCSLGKQFLNVTSTLSNYSIRKTLFQLLSFHNYMCSFLLLFSPPPHSFLVSVLIIWTDFYICHFSGLLTSSSFDLVNIFSQNNLIAILLWVNNHPSRLIFFQFDLHKEEVLEFCGRHVAKGNQCDLKNLGGCLFSQEIYSWVK